MGETVKLMIGVFNLPVVLTFGGLLFSMSACILSFDRRFEPAYLCFIFAGLCDLFDGFVARRVRLTDREKDFGLYIDTVVDVVSFGFTPVILLLHENFNHIVDYFLFGLYSCCAAMRLAVFTQMRRNEEIGTKTFVGLPVTYSTPVFSSLFILGTLLDPAIYRALTRAALALLALLYVARIRIPKPRGVFYVIFPAVAAGYILFWILRMGLSP